MKKSCLAAPLACLLLLSVSRADNIPWVSDLNQAQRQAAAQRRLVLLHFTAPNCGPCRALERSVYSRPEFMRSLMSNYVPVKVDASANPGLAQRFGVRSWPTDILLTPDGVELYRGTSPQDANIYIARIDQVAAHARAGMSEAVTTSQSTVQAPQSNPADRVPINRASPFVPPGATAPSVTTNQYVQATAPSQEAPPTQQQSTRVASASRTASASTALLNNPYVQDLTAGSPQNMANRGGVPQPTARPSTHPGAPPQERKMPALALEGFCPVALLLNKEWTPGNPQWGHIHRGKLYLFSSEAAKAAFWKDPDRFSPVMGGFDIVQFIEGNRLTDGKRHHGVYYRNRYYLFADEQSLVKFEGTPDFYAEKASLAIAEHDRAAIRR